MSTRHHVALATEADLDQVVSTLTGILAARPRAAWTLGEGDDLVDRVRRALWLWLPNFLPLGDIWQVDGGVGAAVWVPPDDEVDTYAAHVEITGTLTANLTLDGGRRYEQFWDWVESRPELNGHWLLDYLGVDTNSRGRGIGAALVEHGLGLAAADGAPAGVIAITEPEVVYFQRFGFRVVYDAAAPDGGPRAWFMTTRRPR